MEVKENRRDRSSLTGSIEDIAQGKRKERQLKVNRKEY